MSIISVRDNEKKIDERERQKTKTERNKGLIQVMASVKAWHASPSSLGGGGVTFLEKYLLERGGGSEIFILVGGCIVGGVILFGGVTEF